MDAGQVERLLLAGVHNHNINNVPVARKLYRQVLALQPTFAEAWRLYGLLEWRGSEAALAVAALRRAVIIDPSNEALRLALVTALDAQGQVELVVRCLRIAVALDPTNTAMWMALARRAALINEPCVFVWRIATRLEPTRAGAYSDLAGALRDSGAFTGAVEMARRAVALEPSVGSLWHNLALMSVAVADHGSAIADYQRAVQLDPNLTESRTNLAWEKFTLGLRLLSQGNLIEGWRHYDWRLHNEERAANQTLPTWNGEALQGRHLLIWGEQGIGDEVMFASCIPDLAAWGGRITLLCASRLVPLFARSFPAVTVHPLPSGEKSGFSHKADLQVAIGSLPRWLRNTASDFPRHQGYLRADPSLVSRFRSCLNRLAGSKMTVGIAWHTAERAQRCLPLAGLIAALPGAQLVNVQHGDHESALDNAERLSGVTIMRMPEVDPLTDLDGYAALLAALDLVVCIDNTAAHLAGALGVPTWILLPDSPEWRWFGGGPSCLWYAQARLFRQHQAGDWSGALEQVSSAFQQVDQAIRVV